MFLKLQLSFMAFILFSVTIYGQDATLRGTTYRCQKW